MKTNIALCLALLVSCTPPRAEVEKREELLFKAARAIKTLHTVKKPAERGDWLWEHPEPGQTFAEFRSQNASRSYEHTIIYIQPLGTFTSEEEHLVTDTAQAIQIFFGRQVKRLDPLPYSSLPKEAWRKYPEDNHPQLLTTAVLDLLVPRLPKDALAMISFTSTDLWPGDDWNFVFGQASFEKPVGVWSLHRFGDPTTEYTKCLQRTLKIALHETGHMLGIKHCIVYECGMNGTNSLDETDAHPMAFCPICELKLWWALDLDVVSRYEALAAYANAHELTQEALFWDSSLNKVKLAMID